MKVLMIFIFLLSFLVDSTISFAAQTSQHHHHAKHRTKHHPKKKSSKKKPMTISSANFDDQYMNFLRRWQIPGSSVAIIKNDKWILSRGYGWADVETQRPMNSDSVFRIGSVSKAITAVAILQLVQEGKLSLDSNVYDILNHLEPLNNAAPHHRINDIKVRHLLEMSPGWITDQGIDPMMGPWSSRMLEQLGNRIPPDCEIAARMMMSTPMQYAPGTQFSYSNISYCMLGLIINKITQQPGYHGYEAYVQQKLFTPYGITSMRIGDSTPGKSFENEVHYYFYEPKSSNYSNIDRINDGLPYGNTQLLQKNYSDGGWVASAPDLARFLQALNHYQILTPKMMRVMIEKPSFQKSGDSYFAKGWNVKYINGQRFVMKTGSFTGTQAFVMFGEDGTVYVALFNEKPCNRKVFLAQLKQLLIRYSKNA
jgi:N-acyl-D-amino-acid deacylase